MKLPDEMPQDKLSTRAQRLMNAARREENTRVANGDVFRVPPRLQMPQAQMPQAQMPQAQMPQNETPKSSSARPGARARDLNRRIRDALREQQEAVYAAPSQAAPGDTSHFASEAAPQIAQDGLSSRTSTHAELKPASAASSSSWEDIADEVAPSGMTANRRGLATGALRGGSRPNSDTAKEVAKTHARWLKAPDAPRVIAAPMPSEGENLDDVAGGTEHHCATLGTHYRISRAADSYDAVFSTLGARLQRLLEREVFPALSGAAVSDLLFVDIETTGLSSASPLFLVGALRLDDAHSVPQLDLFLARDFPEEAALLAAFHQIARGRSLVTFNGKSFDWPYIEGRSRAHRLDFEAPRRHLDLLHHARRTWKHQLPNCKLQTLELHLCGRTRLDDVPGSQIPRVYHEFARRHSSGDGGAHLMAPVLHHNALDILTMAELLCLAGEEL